VRYAEGKNMTDNNHNNDDRDFSGVNGPLGEESYTAIGKIGHHGISGAANTIPFQVYLLM
jgi:hypothetical protein